MKTTNDTIWISSPKRIHRLIVFINNALYTNSAMEWKGRLEWTLRPKSLDKVAISLYG